MPPSNSGATVTIATSGRRRAMAAMMSSPVNAPGNPAGPESADRDALNCRRQSRGCAPRQSGLMKLLSRCAGSTRADPGGGAARTDAISSSSVWSAGGAQATVVGQKAVTPYFGSRAATAATAPAPSSTSTPSTPCTCTSMKPGTRVRPRQIEMRGAASIASTARGSMAAMTPRAGSMTSVPGATTRSGSTRIAARQRDHGRARAAARAAPIATASGPSGDSRICTRSDCCGRSRRLHSSLIASSIMSPEAAIIPPSTIASGSSMVTRFDTAMPMYFAVSRTTEIATPSPARAPWKILSAVMLLKSPPT